MLLSIATMFRPYSPQRTTEATKLGNYVYKIHQNHQDKIINAPQLVTVFSKLFCLTV